MKKFLLMSVFILGSMLSFHSLADSHNSGSSNSMMSTIPATMQGDMQKMMQWKQSKMGNRIMMMGVKLYMMGKLMSMSGNSASSSSSSNGNASSGNSADAQTMMSNGIKLYNMGMQMNGGNSIDMSKCPGMMKGHS